MIPPTSRRRPAWRPIFRAFGLARGVTHTDSCPPRWAVLLFETAARVGGAHIDKMVEAGHGVALAEARIELASFVGKNRVPEHRQDYAGLIICLAREQWPDLSAHDEPEIVWRVPRENHAGLLVASPDPSASRNCLMPATERFARDS